MMGMPCEDEYYDNPNPKENTMTSNIKTLTEAGFPLQLHYTPGAECPFILTADGTSMVGFDDRSLAARTLQDAHDIRVQTDHNGTAVIFDGEELAHSGYSLQGAPRYMVENALQKVAMSGRQWAHQTIDFDPEDIDTTDKEASDE